MSQPAVAPEPPPNVMPSGIRVHLEPSIGGSKKVLLLEDDPAFKEIMTDFLKESGFEVVAVANGVEGVHQVLASDFEVLLCDMMMPTLPGDMFFRAVERMRPPLSHRFIFTTRHPRHTKVS